VTNPVLRGDLRARFRSHKVHVLQAVSLGALGLLAFLGLPPELNQIDRSHQTSLVVALLVVQVVLVTYFASACAAQEIAVEGEKPAIDLIFAPFDPSAIVTGKSLASLITIFYWILQGAPLIVLAAGIRQFPVVDLLPPLRSRPLSRGG
jgi:ABC-type transport system involved in multi-copper enzyme maturation permease subunit